MAADMDKPVGSCVKAVPERRSWMIYLKELRICAERGAYPFNSAAVTSLRQMKIQSPVTILVGDNGSGKSTLLEALARSLRLPSIGSEDAERDETIASVEPLAKATKLTFSVRHRQGFFLRAEDFFGFTRRISAMQAEMKRELARVEEEYEGRSAFTKGQARMAYAGSLHELNRRYGIDPDARSHGEAFLHLFQQRMNGKGLYILDEPEAPLSPIRQLSLCAMIMERAEDSQFIIATHSPILMAIPGAEIWNFDEVPVSTCAYDELEHVAVMKDFLRCPQRYMDRLKESGRDEDE